MKNVTLGFLACGFLLTSVSTIYLLGKADSCVYVPATIQPITLK